MAKKKQQSMKATAKGKEAHSALKRKEPRSKKQTSSKQRLIEQIVEMLNQCDTFVVRRYHDEIFEDLDSRTFSMEPVTAKNLR